MAARCSMQRKGPRAREAPASRPANAARSPPTPRCHSGEGGRGTRTGLLGPIVEVLSTGCNAEPAPCSPTVTTTTLPCAPPFAYHSFVENEVVIRSAPSGTFVRTTTNTVVEDGTQMCTGTGFAASCVWHRVGSITDTVVDTDGEVRTTTSGYDLETPDAGQIVHDHCAPDGTPHPMWTAGVDRSSGGTAHTRAATTSPEGSRTDA